MPLRKFKGQNGPILCTAISPDSRHIASAGEDTTISIRLASTGQITNTLHGHEDVVTCVDFSATGAVSSGGRDKKVKVWWVDESQQTQTTCQTLVGHTGVVTAVKFSPDGWRIASASEDGFVVVWDTETGSETWVFTGHVGAVLCAAWSPNGVMIASGGDDNTVRLWDAHAGVGYGNTPDVPHTARVNDVAFANKTDVCVSASDDASIHIYTVPDLTFLRRWTGHVSPVKCISISRDDLYVASGGHDGTVSLWDAVRGQGLTKIIMTQTGGRVNSVAWFRGGKRVVAGTSCGSVCLCGFDVEVGVVIVCGFF
jgi:WD40 repeat protein